MAVIHFPESVSEHSRKIQFKDLFKWNIPTVSIKEVVQLAPVASEAKQIPIFD